MRDDSTSPMSMIAWLSVWMWSRASSLSSATATWPRNSVGNATRRFGFENHTSDSIKGDLGAVGPPRQLRLIKLARLRTLAMLSRAGLP